MNWPGSYIHAAPTHDRQMLHAPKQCAATVPIPHCITCATLQCANPLQQHAHMPVANTVLCTHAKNKKSYISNQADILLDQCYHVQNHHMRGDKMPCPCKQHICATSAHCQNTLNALLHVLKISLLLSQFQPTRTCHQSNIMGG